MIAGALGYEAVFVVGACCAGVSAAMAMLIADPSGQPVTVT